MTVNGVEIISTPGHKYYMPETKKWVAAERLGVGEKVLLSNGEYGIIEKTRAIHYDKPQTTYNFEVEDFHTYYVGDGVLVHNRGGCNKEAEEVATELGYTKVKGQTSHGQAIFQNNKAPSEVRFITRDIDSHVGGYWKGASTIQNLASKSTRSGTYDIFLRWIAP